MTAQAMSQPWYTYPYGLLFGQGDPGVGGEHGTDLDVPFHTPLTLPASGTITAMNWDAWGGTITWKLDYPINGVPYAYMTHMDTFNSQLQLNGHYEAGTFIGLSGGQLSGGSHPTTSYWSGGPHLELGLSYGPAWGHGAGFADVKTHPELNPYSWIQSIKSNGVTPIPFSGSVTGYSDLAAYANEAVSYFKGNPLNPNDTVIQVLYDLDTWMYLENPFNVNIASIQDQVSLPGGINFSFADPISYLEDFMQNLAYDITAVTIRALFLFLGAWICFKAVSNAMDNFGVGIHPLKALGNIAQAAPELAALGA